MNLFSYLLLHLGKTCPYNCHFYLKHNSRLKKIVDLTLVHTSNLNVSIDVKCYYILNQIICC